MKQWVNVSGYNQVRQGETGLRIRVEITRIRGELTRIREELPPDPSLENNPDPLFLLGIRTSLKFFWLYKINHTVCPRSSDPFYILGCFINWVTTYWTYSMYCQQNHLNTVGLNFTYSYSYKRIILVYKDIMLS